MDDEDDPFACFDDDGDSNDDDDESNNPLNDEIKRDPNFGVLSFHAGTEQALLKHIEAKLNAEFSGESHDASSFVINFIDEYCLDRHWMMHIGKEKAVVIKRFIQECCEHFPLDKHLLFVELGTYCGYSSIMITKALMEMNRQFSFYTVEVVPENVKVATELVRLAGLEKNINILLLNPEKETLPSLLSHKISEKSLAIPTIDFLFIDHDKSLYLSDLQQLETSGFLVEGSHVAADNVIFAEIDDYRDYIATLTEAGITKSRLEETMLEYSEPDYENDESKKNLMRDGIGKLLTIFTELLSLFFLFLILLHSLVNRALNISKESCM